MAKNKKLSVIAIVISVLSLLVTLVVACWGFKQNESIATRSGNFAKSELALSIGGYFINENSSVNVFYGVDFSDSLLYFSDIPFAIHNQGDKTSEETEVFIRYPSLIKTAVAQGDIEMKYSGNQELSRKTTTAEPYDMVSVFLGNVNPSFSINTNELICIPYETSVTDTVYTMTSDSVELEVPFRFDYSLGIKLAISAKDISTKRYSFSMQYLKAKDMDELLLKVKNLYISNENSLSKRKELYFYLSYPKLAIVQENIISLKTDYSNAFIGVFDKKTGKISLLNINGDKIKEI